MGDRFTPTTCFPPAVDACTVVGPVKKLTRLARILVSAACGDNQSSFADPQSSILINVVTGGQISVFVPDLPRPQTLDLRPFLSGGYFYWLVPDCAEGDLIGRFTTPFNKLVSCLRCGGKSRFSRLLLAPPLDFEPVGRWCSCEVRRVAVSVSTPTDEGYWSGISETNFTVDHFARSLLEDVATEFDNFYQWMQQAGLSARPKLVGSGNGIRQNRG